MPVISKERLKEPYRRSRERRYGSFSRSFDITGIDEGSITAAYNNGILELNLPKAVPVVPESRRIAID